MTPNSGSIASIAPPNRGAFLLNSMAIDFPSADHRGRAQAPFQFVNRLDLAAPATYNCCCPFPPASERNASCPESGDHASDSSFFARGPALTRTPASFLPPHAA